MKKPKGVAVSCIGATHVKGRKECQDRSKCIDGKKFTAIVVCDGHGGEKHFRSAVGAEIAISVFENAISEFADNYFSLLKKSKLKTVLKNFEKHLIFSWRETVEEHFFSHAFSEKEIDNFDNTTKDFLKSNPHIAYGSTFLSCFTVSNELFVIQLGDGEIRLITNDEQVVSPIPEDINLAFGMTTSLCNDDAIKYFRDFISKTDDVNACVLCTDGVKNSFDTNEHYNECCKILAQEMNISSLEEYKKELECFLSNLSLNGSGDDVSIGVMKK